jgi:hypothetical protein
VTRLVLLALLAIATLAACSLDGGDADTVQAERTTTAEVTEGAETPEQPGLSEDPDDVDFLDLASVSAVRQGDLLAVSVTTYEEWDETNLERLSVLYDTDLDGAANYFGHFSLTKDAPRLMISGENKAFEPVPVERPDDRTAQFVHLVEVLFIPAGDSPDFNIQVAVESTFEGQTDRVPDSGWLPVPVAPSS